MSSRWRLAIIGADRRTLLIALAVLTCPSIRPRRRSRGSDPRSNAASVAVGADRVDVRPNWAEAPSSPANWEARRAMPDILAASLSPASQRGAVSCRPGRNGRSCLGSARQPTRQGVPMDTPSPSPGSASKALSLSCWAANPFGVSGALLVAAGAQRQGAARDCSLRNTRPRSCTRKS